MTQEITITDKGVYYLYQYASTNSKTELLKHLRSKQNVIYAAQLEDQLLMKSLCDCSILHTIHLENNLALFQFTFNNLSDALLKKIFLSTIDQCEASNMLPKELNTKIVMTTSLNSKIIKVNIWKTGILPKFAIEIY